MFMAGIYYQRADPDGWKARIEDANNHLSPPLPATDILSIIRSLERKSYEYTCRASPMASYCNSALCRTRAYGVGNAPAIEGLAVMESDPRIWFMNVGDHRLELGTDDLQQFHRFHRACMENLHICYPMMKQEAWIQVLQAAMEHVTVLETTKDLKREGKFGELLEEFLTNRATGHRLDDLLLGRPWDDQEGCRYWFRLQDFQRFLKRESERDFPRAQCTLQIRSMGGDTKFMMVKGKGINVWWVPSAALERTPAVDPPPMQESPI